MRSDASVRQAGIASLTMSTIKIVFTHNYPLRGATYYTVTPRYYADSDITRSVVDPDFLPPGENAKWACLNLLRIALTILKKH